MVEWEILVYPVLKARGWSWWPPSAAGRWHPSCSVALSRPGPPDEASQLWTQMGLLSRKRAQGYTMQKRIAKSLAARCKDERLGSFHVWFASLFDSWKRMLQAPYPCSFPLKVQYCCIIIPKCSLISLFNPFPSPKWIMNSYLYDWRNFVIYIFWCINLVPYLSAMRCSPLEWPEVLLVVGPLLWALDGDAEDGVAARGVSVHVGGAHAPVLVTYRNQNTHCKCVDNTLCMVHTMKLFGCSLPFFLLFSFFA
jgi:hypothetical protein